MKKNIVWILFDYLNLQNKGQFYLNQFLWFINSFIQSLNIYVYGYFLVILGKEFGEINNNLNLFDGKIFLFQKLNEMKFFEVVLIIIFFAIISNIINFLLIRYSNNFFCKCAENIQYFLLRKYVYMDYESFLNLRLDKKSSSILMDSQKLYSIFMLLGNFLFNFVNLIIIFSILIYINVKVTLITFSILGVLYYFSANLSKTRLVENSKIFSTLGIAKLNLINTCLNGLRELKIYNLEKFNLLKFRNLTSKVAQSKASTVSLSLAPRYFIESFFFISIGFLIFLIMKTNFFEKSLFAYLIILIISFSRLVPSFQYFFSFYSAIQDSSISLKLIHKELLIKKNEGDNIQKLEKIKNYQTLSSVDMKNVSFKYKGDSKFIIKNFNLKVKSGDKIFVSGETGSGKSTFLDIFNGLIKPSSGEIILNKKIKIKSLFRSLKQAYVSQFPFLYNSSILSNITMSQNHSGRDIMRVIKIVKLLELTDIIKDKKDLKKNIGDFGSKISGGQKQRICLARALFYNPEVLILDESLNAVDKAKREKILKKLMVFKKLLIFYVSHDLSDKRFFRKRVFFKKNK